MARKKSRSRGRSSAMTVHRSSPVARGRARSFASGARVDVTGPVIMAALLGLLEREGITIPHFGAVGEAGTIAIAGFVALKAGVIPAGMRRTVENIVLSAGVLATFDLVKSGQLPGSKKKAEGDGPYITHATE